MLREALEFLFERADEVAENKHVRKVDVPGDGRSVLLEHDGTLIERPVPPPLRKHKVDTISDLIAAAKQWNTAPVIWLAETGATLVVDDADRRETVTMPLIKTAVFAKLCELRHNGAAMDQDSLIRLLRKDLRDAENQPTILATVRKIKFRSLAEGHSDIQHGNESMGKTIENEVSGAGGLPEGLRVPTAVYLRVTGASNQSDIDLMLEIHAKTQKFSLQPIPDQIEEATWEALLGIQREIEAALPGVPVFFGSP